MLQLIGALVLSRTNSGPQTAGNLFPDIINSIKSAWHLNVTSIQWLRGLGSLEEEWDFKILLRWAGLELLDPRSPPLLHVSDKTHHCSQQTSWWRASSQRGLWVWSLWVCSCGGPSQPPPGGDRKRRPPLWEGGWCHPSSTWSPHCTAPCGPGPSPCWLGWSPRRAETNVEVKQLKQLTWVLSEPFLIMAQLKSSDDEKWCSDN